MLRAAGYLAGLFAFVAAFSGINVPGVQWHRYELRDAFLIVLIISFPVACVLDFALRKKPALPKEILWPLRFANLAVWLWINWVFFVFRGPLAN